MGLFTKLLMLPLAPVEGVVWVARQLESQAYEQYLGPAALRRQLEQLQQAADAGEISEEQFLAEEEALLERLDALQEAEEGGARW